MGRVIFNIWPFNRWRAWRDVWRFRWHTYCDDDKFPSDYFGNAFWFNGYYFYGHDAHVVMQYMKFAGFWGGMPVHIGPPRMIAFRNLGDAVGPWGTAMERDLRSGLL